MIDFELPEDVKDVQRRVAAFVNEVVLPSEAGAAEHSTPEEMKAATSGGGNKAGTGGLA